jgi:hypothetical protein
MLCEPIARSENESLVHVRLTNISHVKGAFYF